jgi:hypothetical protein
MGHWLKLSDFSLFQESRLMITLESAKFSTRSLSYYRRKRKILPSGAFVLLLSCPFKNIYLYFLVKLQA